MNEERYAIFSVPAWGELNVVYDNGIVCIGTFARGDVQKQTPLYRAGLYYRASAIYNRKEKKLIVPITAHYFDPHVFDIVPAPAWFIEMIEAVSEQFMKDYFKND